MIKIAIVAPFPSIEKLAKEVFQEHTEYMRMQSLDDTEYSLEILVAATTREVLEHALDCDVLIARGGTYLDLCKTSLNIPLVELIINGTDIVNMFLKLHQLYGSRPAAILGTQNMVLGVEKLAQQLHVDITPYLLRENTHKEILQNVEQAVMDGKEILIGGMTGCSLADEHGMKSLLIESGRDAMWNAISEAKQIAKLSQLEQEKALGLQALLDNAYEGLLAVNQTGHIFFLNASAIRILHLSSREQYLGKHYTDVFASVALRSILSSQQEYMDEIIEYKNTHLSVKKVNLFMRGVQFGSVVTMLNASQIQSTEDKLRGKLYQKGHVAKYTFSDVLTCSQNMISCIQDAKAYAQTDSNIMLVGESGTGKELMSQSIHNWSNRARNNFVALNCAALPENLLESELFGYVEGAFTGAVKGGKEGLFEIAHNGTIFLDEISEIPLSLQGRLLRVLQEREIMRLGDSKITPINIRVIAATNKDLAEMVEAGKFRRDLYYRLYVLQLNLPPLRERKADIPLLIQHFLNQFRAKMGAVPIELSLQDFNILQSLSWNGNIRELRNFCERLAVLYQPGSSTSDLIHHLLSRSQPHLASAPSAATSTGHSMEEVRDLVNEKEYQKIKDVLIECNGNKTAAAERLGISRSTLWRMLKRFEDIHS